MEGEMVRMALLRLLRTSSESDSLQSDGRARAVHLGLASSRAGGFTQKHEQFVSVIQFMHMGVYGKVTAGWRSLVNS